MHGTPLQYGCVQEDEMGTQHWSEDEKKPAQVGQRQMMWKFWQPLIHTNEQLESHISGRGDEEYMLVNELSPECRG